MSVDELLKVQNSWFNCMMWTSACGVVALAVTSFMLFIDLEHVFFGGPITVVLFSFSRFAYIKKNKIDILITNALALFRKETDIILAKE
jgi:hypothetical protein|tara:strand:+ start:110 stop:376 length:267 start_codon:yes stop_codon:yes gene_type:complete